MATRIDFGSKIQISQFNFLHLGINGSSKKSVFGTKIHLEFHFIIENEMHLDGGAVFESSLILIRIRGAPFLLSFIIIMHLKKW